MNCAAAIDFFVATVTFGLLYVVVMLKHARRRIVHLNITDGPTARWVAQQVPSAPRSPWQNPYVERLIGSVTPSDGKVLAFPRVGGLHHRYERRAA